MALKIQNEMLLLNFNIQAACQPMEGPQKALVACFRSSTKEVRNTAGREPNEAIDGVQQARIMTPVSNGDPAPVAFCASAVIQMASATTFHSYMAVKCTQLVQLKTKPGPGLPILTTMTWTSSGAIVEVRKMHISLIISHNALGKFMKSFDFILHTKRSNSNQLFELSLCRR